MKKEKIRELVKSGDCKLKYLFEILQTKQYFEYGEMSYNEIVCSLNDAIFFLNSQNDEFFRKNKQIFEKQLEELKLWYTKVLSGFND